MDTFPVPPPIAFSFCTRLLVIRDMVTSFFCHCATVTLIFNTLALSFLPVQILIILLRPGSNVSLAISFFTHSCILHPFSKIFYRVSIVCHMHFLGRFTWLLKWGEVHHICHCCDTWPLILRFIFWWASLISPTRILALGEQGAYCMVVC